MVKDISPTHTVQVTVLIGGRPFLLKVSAADEATVHRLAQEINQKVAAIQTGNPSRDKQDCLSLALLMYAVELHRAVGSPVQDTVPSQGQGL
jgi:cell division protein ZapA (FtsZ GTPase activity inhibitor)